MFSPAFLERVRTHFLLSDIIGRSVALKRTGREYSGLCPFHGEKTPSFTVNNEKNFYHCFGCGAHGDAIEFVKQHQRLSWREAVEKLANEAGIPLPQLTEQEREEISRSAQLLEVMEAATQYFEAQLKRSEHASARSYLQQRGLSDATCAQFRLGLAPDSRDGLKQHLLKAGFNEALQIEAGLLSTPEGMASYDRFRSRLIFPIHSITGKVIAFGGRLMGEAKNAPKYLNSPETPLFKKGEVLFNLHRAGESARKAQEIFITEGYMDVIAMVQGGITNVVATLGTAVTPEHLRRLWHYAPEPTLCLDGDAAGARAMMRTAELCLPLLKPGQSLRFVQLPKGEDPDSLLKAGKGAVLERGLKGARGLTEALWRSLSPLYPESAEGKAALEHKLLQLTLKIEDMTVRQHARAYFRRQVWGERGTKQGAPKRLRSVQVEQMESGADALSTRYLRQALKLLLLQPALRSEVETEMLLHRLPCPNEALSALRDALLELPAEDHEPPEQLRARLEEAGFAHAIAAVMKESIGKSATETYAAARVFMKQLLEAESLTGLEQEYQELQVRLAAAMDEDGYSRMLALQEQIKQLKNAPILVQPAAD